MRRAGCAQGCAGACAQGWVCTGLRGGCGAARRGAARRGAGRGAGRAEAAARGRGARRPVAGTGGERAAAAAARGAEAGAAPRRHRPGSLRAEGPSRGPGTRPVLTSFLLPLADTGAMWALLALLCLMPPGSSATVALAEMRQTPPPAGASARAQPPSAAQGALPKAPLTASELPARGADPALSLNLGLNFKIKVWSQGSFRLADPSAEPALADLLPADTADPISSANFLPPANRFLAKLPPGEALSGSSSTPGSGWLMTSSADEPSPDASHGPGSWGETAGDWDGSPVPQFRSSPGGRPPNTTPFESELLEPVPTAQLSLFRPVLGSQPDVMLPAASQPTPASSRQGRSKGLEFKINIDLTAGLDQEVGAPPTHVLSARGGKGQGTRWKYPLLPSLKAGISEIASKLGTSSFFGPTLPPDWHQERRGPQERNSTDGIWDQPQDTSPSLPRATEPGEPLG
ncbi:proline-rich transmembrane protein 4 [Natator depressus]|uniref:proline-rich transmembrane protein 4 n=1 Tax=Natator depressus TaxID=27790 RepID=UPI003EB754C2